MSSKALTFQLGSPQVSLLHGVSTGSARGAASGERLRASSLLPRIPNGFLRRTREAAGKGLGSLLNARTTQGGIRASLSNSDSSAFRGNDESSPNSNLPPDSGLGEPPVAKNESWWRKWQSDASEMRKKIAKLGLSAVLAYGLFDGVTYTTFFVLAFLGYEKSTGNNPAANIQALLGIVVLMWAGNNVTRPFRVLGAAALAPFIDKALKKLQQKLNLPSLFSTFLVVVALFASMCLSVVGLLILSRLRLV